VTGIKIGKPILEKLELILYSVEPIMKFLEMMTKGIKTTTKLKQYLPYAGRLGDCRSSRMGSIALHTLLFLLSLLFSHLHSGFWYS
jgi:hypothetical protein